MVASISQFRDACRLTLRTAVLLLLAATTALSCFEDARGAIARPWPVQTRFPQQIVRYYFEESANPDVGIWYDELTRYGHAWTYADPASMWGKLTIREAFRDGMAMLTRAAPGLRFEEIDAALAAKFPDAVAVVERPKEFITCLTSTRKEGSLVRRTIAMNRYCHAGIAAHEMLHILGVRHGQQSPVRETFACVFTGLTYRPAEGIEFTLPDNLSRGHGNFRMDVNSRILGDYDFDSIMHYSDSVMKKGIAEDIAYPRVTLARRLHPGPLTGPADCMPETGISYWEEHDGNGRSYHSQRFRLSSIDRWALREMYFHSGRPDTGIDLNGDGYADLLLSIAGGGAFGPGTGTSVIYGGRYGTATPGLQLQNGPTIGVPRHNLNSAGGSVGQGLAEAMVSGDFNGDYLLDVALGYPQAANGAGRILIVYADAEGATRSAPIVLTGGAGRTIGYALQAGDFNGDGISDLAAGFRQPGLGLDASSGLRICNGSLDGLDTGNCRDEDPASLLPTDHDGHNGSRLGDSMIAGDFNGDGYTDLVVADSRARADGAHEAGAIFYVPGGPAGLTAAKETLYQGVGLLPDRAESGDRWGEVLASGDLNNDGVTDLIVANPAEDIWIDDTNHIDSGYVTIIPGNRLHGISAENQGLTGLQIESFGLAAGQRDGFGTALLAVDTNGDGYSDLVVGTPNRASRNGKSIDGAIHIIEGGPRGIQFDRTTTIEAGDACRDCDLSEMRFGASLTHGDYDGNGFVDLVVGAPGRESDSGRVVVRYHGSPFSTPATAVGRSFPAYQTLGPGKLLEGIGGKSMR